MARIEEIDGVPNDVQMPRAAAKAAVDHDLFSAAEQKHGLPAGLLSAMAGKESNYKNDAVSSKGALGMLQFMPGTAKAYGVDPTDPASAIDGAGRYMKDLLHQFGDIGLALAAYNAGPSAVRKHNGIPPYKETRRYVQKILSQIGLTYGQNR